MSLLMLFALPIASFAQQEFGDAPPSYGTLIGSGAAVHTAAGNTRFGASKDFESNGIPSVGADGDDQDGTDDEDGITFLTPITPGSNAIVRVVVTPFVDIAGWIDFNANGVFDNPGERIFSGNGNASGTNDIGFNVPASAVVTNTYARFRCWDDGNIIPQGSLNGGEVEDYAINISVEMDFGDAPNTYGTTLANNGARHNALTPGSPRMGPQVDLETDGVPSTNAQGDDSTGAVDDEDGAIFDTPFIRGENAMVRVQVTGASGFLTAFIDYDQNGTFDPPGEAVIQGQAVVVGVNNFTIPVPLTAATDDTFMRFRVTSTSGTLPPMGLAADGEVEDYQITILHPHDFGDAPDSYGTTLASNGPRHRIALAGTDTTIPFAFGAMEDAELDGAPSSDALGDDTTGPDADDEDGIFFLDPLVPGKDAQLDIAIANPGFMNAFIDFNSNGQFDDPAERVFNSEPALFGVNTYTISVPSTAVVTNRTYARFRISGTATRLGPTGLVDSAGEVEDYAVEILGAEIICPPDIDLGCNPSTIPPPDPASVMTNLGFCSLPMITWQNDFAFTNTLGCTVTILRTYRASDSCFNFRSCEQRITYTLDTTPPLIGSLPTALTQAGADIDGSTGGDQSGRAVALSADGNRIVIGAPNNNDNGTISGQVRVFELQGANWVQLGTDLQGNSLDRFGTSVDITADGNVIAVGAIGNSDSGTNAGQVRIFRWSGSTWVQLGQNLNGEAANDQFGWSLALASDGGRLVVGAPFNQGNGTNAGHSRVFEFDGSGWFQAGTDIDGDATNDNDGHSVDISADGERIVLGAIGADGSSGVNSGHARVFQFINFDWVQIGVDIDGEDAGDASGTVAMSANGNRIIIGAELANGGQADSGHARVFEWDGAAWNQAGQDLDGILTGDAFSTVSISANGGFIAVGGAGMNSAAGQTRVFYWSGSNWMPLGNNVDGEAAGDQSGTAVALASDGMRLAIGATMNDDGGNNAGHAQVFNLLDPPPTNTVVSCDGSSAPSVTGQAFAIDNCDPSPIVSFSDSFGPGTCTEELVITRTWTAIDSCGNSNSYVQVITSRDTTPPTLVNCPTNAVLAGDINCQVTVPDYRSIPTAIDTCDSVPTISQLPAPGTLIQGPTNLVVTLTATDACGNSSNCTFNLDVQCPPDIQVTQTVDTSCICANGSINITITVSNSAPLAINSVMVNDLEYPACSTNLGGIAAGATSTYTCPVTTTGTSNTVVVTGFAAAVPFAVTNTVNWMIDTTPPVIVSCASNSTIQCIEDLPAADPGSVVATDNCGGPVTITVTDTNIFIEVCAGSVFYEYTATDACGNSVTCTQQISINDSIPPTATFPSDITVACGTDTSTNTLGAATGIDNCAGRAVFITFTDSVIAGSCPQEETITRAWRVRDECGNQVTTNQIITVVDSTTPTLFLPADVSGCSINTNIITTGSATATDNCSTNITITFSDTIEIIDCTQSIMRNWLATDECGNSTNAVQIIANLMDTTPPVLTIPSNIVVGCTDDTTTNATGVATATDNCFGAVAIMFVDTITPGSDGCPGELVINRNWIATDACGNSVANVQRIFVTDLTAPVITFCPANFTTNATASCDVTIPDLTGLVTFIDACGSSVSVRQDPLAGTSVFGPSVESIILFIEDNCGNSTNCVVEMTVTCDRPGIDVVHQVDAACFCTNDLVDFTIDVLNIGTQPLSNIVVTSVEYASCSTNIATLSTNSNFMYTCAVNATNEISTIIVSGEANGATVLATNVVTWTLDTTPPMLIIPTNLVIECGDDTSTNATGVATAADDCDPTGEITEVFTFSGAGANLPLAIPDNSINGVFNIQSVASAIDIITKVTVDLDISGTYNGDLAVFLRTSGTESVLLNRVGRTATNDFGFADGGFFITLDDEASIDVHLAIGPGGGDAFEPPLIGIFQPDGRLINPAQVVDTDPRLAPLSVFNGLSASGNWDLLLVDLADGDTSTLDNWSITISGIDTNAPPPPPGFSLSFQDTITPGESCPTIETITRTWIAVDNCNNTNMMDQIITVVDTTAPVIVSCASNITVQCNEDIPLPDPSSVVATDSCGGPVTVTVTATNAALEGCTGDISFEYTVTDACGNSVMCTQQIVVNDLTPPTAIFPPNITVACGTDTSTNTLGAATGIDNCSGNTVFVSFIDNVIAGSCPQEETITRAWRVSDTCGNTVTTNQIITVVDSVIPTLFLPTDVSGCNISTNIASTGTATATDNCSTNITITFSDSIAIIDCTQSITRTWLATDQCGNSTNSVQLITNLIDTTPPTLTLPADLDLSCDDDTSTNNTGLATATDNCTGPINITFSDSTFPSDSCPGDIFIRRTWRAEDACNNVVTENQIISIGDNAPPNLTCPPNFSTNISDLACQFLIPDLEPVTTFSDLCNDTNYMQNPAPGTLMTGPGVFPITITVMDDCGFSTNCIVEMTVTCNQSAIGITKIADASCVCANDLIDFTITVTNLGTVALTNVVVNDLEYPTCSTNIGFLGVGQSFIYNCPVNATNELNTVIAAGEAAGSMVLATNIASWQIDSLAPSITNCPPNSTVDCFENVPPSDLASFGTIDNCSTSVIHSVFATNMVGNVCSGRVEYVYAATDNCGNQSFCTQTVFVVDNVAPSLTVPPDVFVSCSAETNITNTGTATATDNCVSNSVTITFSDSFHVCGGPNFIIREWTAIDACGNTNSIEQNIQIIGDTTPPDLILPADLAGCNLDTSTNNTGRAMAFDICSTNLTITFSDSISTNGCTALISRTWTARDEFGNSTNGIQVIANLQDTIPPTITCPANESLTGDTACNITLPDYRVRATILDNCSTNIIVTQLPAPGTIVTGPTNIVVTLTASDDCGNTNSCSLNLQVNCQLFDFADAPSSYGTLLADNGARHQAINTNNPYAFGPFGGGGSPDYEADGQPTTGADGDDLSDQDDEGGISFRTAMIPGRTAIIRVSPRRNGGQVTAFIDFNANGVFDVPSERIINSVLMNLGQQEFNIAIPSNAVPTNTYARFRITPNATFNSPTGSVLGGEVEDYAITLDPISDFGDAPISYGTLRADGGAQHAQPQNGAGLVLGFGGNIGGALDTKIDFEPDGLPSIGADGDNLDGIDDESAVTFNTALVPGRDARIFVHARLAGGFLTAFIDYDANGVFDAPNETIIASRPLNQGINTIDITVPSNAVPAVTYARFRLTRDNGPLGPTGIALDGEVEDYQVTLDPPLDFGDLPASYSTVATDNGAVHAQPVGGLNFNPLRMGPLVDTESDGIPSTHADGDDLDGSDDEDGVTFLEPFAPGRTTSIRVNSTRTDGFLNVFVDFDGNGVFDLPQERVINRDQLSQGNNNRTITLPTNAVAGVTYARFRLGTDTTGGQPFDGLQVDGEVEDYEINIIAPELTCTNIMLTGCNPTNIPVPDISAVTTNEGFCSTPFITHLGDTTNVNASCIVTIERVYEAFASSCNMSITCTQLITYVEDTLAPNITIPADIMGTNISTAVINTGMATAIDSCSTNTISFSDSVSSSNNYQVISRTWQAQDACLNVASGIQRIFNFTNTTPVVLTIPADFSDCNTSTNVATTGQAFASGGCTTPTITFSDLLSVSNCTTIIFRTWTAMDSCRSVTSDVQRIVIINDLEAPTLTPPADVFECNQPSTPAFTGTATTSDNCDTPILSFSDDVAFIDCTEIVTRTWTSTDGCGNSTSAVQIIEITNDTTPPTLTLPADYVGCGKDVSPTVTGTATPNDDCTIDNFGFFDTPLSSSPGVEVIERTWDVFDSCGNSTSAVQIITLLEQADLSVSLSGSPSPLVNGDFYYITVTITNNGPCDATGVILSSLLPDELALEATSATNCTFANNLLTCLLGDLAQGATTSIVIDTIVSTTNPVPVFVVSDVSAIEFDTDLNNNTNGLAGSILPNHRLTLIDDFNGYGVITGTTAGVYLTGSMFDIEAESIHEKYVFDYWEIDGSQIDTQYPLQLTLTNNTSVQVFFRPIFLDVTSDTTSELGNWRFDFESGIQHSDVTICNTASVNLRLIEPFWYAYPKTLDQFLLNPDGRTNEFDYVDITDQVNELLPTIGNGDLVLDPGECVTVSQLSWYYEDVLPFDGHLLAHLFADPPPPPYDASKADTDNDGILNAWEELHGLNKNHPYDAKRDTDRDGMDNLGEFLSDTEPNDPDSVLRLDRVTFESLGAIIEWQGGSSVTQYIDWAESPLGPWTTIYTNRPPTDSQGAIMHPFPEVGHGVYRINTGADRE